MQCTNGVHVRNETLNDKERREQKPQNDKAYALILPQAESVPPGPEKFQDKRT
jgi:hypothetical protein